ncbi:sensor histidine kinase [Paenibacillus senegalensis]|uniref:sensor histidine kinase n=1 Tax=Paenibacillus senegalensis TaxID=1465766 RepID=UPI000288DC93|nr:ATP-binding protein [Paenibacillus senegalensis]
MNRLKNWFPFNWFGDLIHLCRKLITVLLNKVLESLRLQLIFTFIICLLFSLLVFATSSAFFGEVNKTARIDYTQGKQRIEQEARHMVAMLQNPYLEEEQLKQLLQQQLEMTPLKVLVLNMDGQVLYKSEKATETEVDVHQMIANAMQDRIYNSFEEEFMTFYPVDLISEKAYLVVSGVPAANITMIPGKSPLSPIAASVSFLVLFYVLTKRKMKNIEELALGLLEISKGNLHHRVATRGKDELGSLGRNINHMAEELHRTIEEERKAERTKNELITNVSHDLRTPLTLIIGYLRLLKDKNYEDERQADAYLQIVSNKSEKLKSLIDDLFEYTKLSSMDSPIESERLCLKELLEQLVEELVTYADENGVKLERTFPPGKLMVSIDAPKMIRVFENLLSNAIKYSKKPGAIRLSMTTEEDSYVQVTVINRGDPIPEEELERLFDRFYRVDASRSSDTGGSGLGLAIAKSIVEAHGGLIWAESDQTEIRFCVRLQLA